MGGESKGPSICSAGLRGRVGGVSTLLFFFFSSEPNQFQTRVWGRGLTVSQPQLLLQSGVGTVELDQTRPDRTGSSLTGGM